MGRRDRGFVLAVGAAAALPVLVSAVHAVWVGWTALGDDAVIVTRAYDVLSTHPPLLGQYSASSGVLGQEVHSLGPLQYWLLTLPAHGPTWAPALVTALVNAACVLACVALAHRRGGRRLAVAAGLGLALASGSVTAETWHTVWNPSAALMPLTLLFFCCWELACDRATLAPLAVVLASFVAQAHLVYVAPALGCLAVAAVGLAVRRPAGLRRALAWSVVAGLVCWIAPLAEEAIHRPGNLELVVRSARAGGAKLGAGAGANAVWHAIGVVPWFLRAPREGLSRLADVGSSSPLAVLTALLLLAALGVALAAGLRARRADVAAGAALGLVLCAAIFAVTASTPSTGQLYISISYTLRWAGPAGMFCWLVAAYAAVALAPRRVPRLAWAGAAGVVVAGVVVAATSAGADRLQVLYGPLRASAARADAALAPAARRVRVDGPAGAVTPAGFDVPAGLVFQLRRHGRAPQSTIFAAQFGRRYRPRDTQAVLTVGDAPPGGRPLGRLTVPGAGRPVAVTLGR